MIQQLIVRRLFAQNSNSFNITLEPFNITIKDKDVYILMAENKYFLILVISVVLFSTKTNPTKEVQMHPKKINTKTHLLILLGHFRYIMLQGMFTIYLIMILVHNAS